MKKTCLLSLLFALLLPVAAGAAMDHGNHGHGSAHHGDHSSTKDAHGEMMRGMVMIGEQNREGVKAMAHLKDVEAAMKKAGMNTTHHVAIMFADMSGKPVTAGQAAVKITGPDGKTSDPVKLVGMDGHFGADLTLKRGADYRFEIGTKLPDGKARQFEFKHAVH